jgi:hydroxyacylglutathione hydrolase
MPISITVIPVTPYEQNCSILLCTKTGSAVVVDPGGDVDRILSYVKRIHARVEKVLLTHGHLDHVGGATELAKILNAPIWGPHEGDKFWLDQLEQSSRMMGFPVVNSFVPDQWLKDQDIIRFGNISLDVIHCPGHTPGHVVFFHKESKTAFVGDVLFQGSVGRTDFPGSSFEELADSITQKLWPLGDDVRFIPGHGPDSTFGEERESNPYVADSCFR